MRSIWESWLCLIHAKCIKNASEHAGWAKWVTHSLLVKNNPSSEGNIIWHVNTPTSERGMCLEAQQIKQHCVMSGSTYLSIACIAICWYTKTAAIFESIRRYTIATVMWVSFRYHQWLLLTCVISLPCFTLQYTCHISFQVSSFVLCDDILKQFWLRAYQNCNVSDTNWLMLLCPCEPWYSTSEAFLSWSVP